MARGNVGIVDMTTRTANGKAGGVDVPYAKAGVLLQTARLTERAYDIR